MRLRKQGLLEATLLLQCAVWVALAPVAAQLHQAFAPHRHVYCPEHQRFEDVSNDDHVDINPGPGPVVAVNQHPASGDRPDCLLSNLTVHGVPTVPFFSTIESSTGPEASCEPEEVFGPGGCLHFAPKHSPPA